MKLLPEHDLDAASERIEQAEALFRIRHYSPAIDTVARAVVSALRVYFFKKYGVTASNDHRYASESRLKAELRRKKLHRSVKGDFLKYNAQRPIEAVRRIVDEEVER